MDGTTGTGTGTGTATAPAASPQTGAPTHNGSSAAGTDVNHKSLHEKGRGKISWGKDVWERIDKAVEIEMKRTRIGARFLAKKMVPPKTTSVPTDSYTSGIGAGGTPVLSVDEGATTRINEYYVEFELTPQQVDQEEGDFNQLGHSTAVTLATKAANTLAQAEDLIIFQGLNAINGASPFVTSTVLNQGSPTDTGLLDQPLIVRPAAGGVVALAPAGPGPLQPPVQVIQVAPLAPAVAGVIYGPNTFEAVAQGYSQLQASGHYGPYALVLETIPYADTYAPLPATLTLTADRIKPLMPAGFFGTGTLPPNPNPPVVPPAAPFFGVMVSLGGNTMDLVSGLEPIVAFMQEDTNGNFRFRVLQRFALRIKDTTGIIAFQFN